MKLIWKNSHQNQNFAGFRGEGFVFQAQPNENNESSFQPFYYSNANPESLSWTESVSTNIAEIVGKAGVTETITNPPWYRDNTTSRTDGFLSEGSREFYNVVKNVARKIAPTHHLSNEVLASLPGLNLVNGQAENRYLDISNVAHQGYLEGTMRYIRTGNNIQNASLTAVKLAKELIPHTDSVKKEMIKGPGGTSSTEKSDKHRSFLRKIYEAFPLNWPGRWNSRRKNKNNLDRSELTTNRVSIIRNNSEQKLQEEVNNMAEWISQNKQGNLNRLEEAASQNNLRAWQAFVDDVVANPQEFINGNGGEFHGFNFAEICSPPNSGVIDVNRIRLLDTILDKKMANESVESQKINQENTTMTSVLSNLNTREILVQQTINNITNEGIERIRNGLPPQQSTSTENSDNLSEKKLVNDIIDEIIRINKVMNPENGFNLSAEVFAGSAIKKDDENHIEKIPYLLNYLQNEDNAEVLTHFEQNISNNFHKWINKFEVSQSADPFDGLETDEVRASADNLLNSAQSALESAAGLNEYFQPDNQDQLLENLQPINNFIFNFDSTKRLIERINIDNQGILKPFLERMSEIHSKMSELSTNVVSSLQSENTRMTTPITHATDEREAVFPANRNPLAVLVPIAWNEGAGGIANEFNNFRQQISGVDGEGGFNIPARPVDAEISGAIQNYLSFQAKKDREIKFQTDLSDNSIKQWHSLSKFNEGRDISLLQAAFIGDNSNTTYTAGNAYSFNNLSVHENRKAEDGSTTELVLRSYDEENGDPTSPDYVAPGTRFIIRPGGSNESPRIIIKKLIPDDNGNLPSEKTAPTFILYSANTQHFEAAA